MPLTKEEFEEIKKRILKEGTVAHYDDNSAAIHPRSENSLFHLLEDYVAESEGDK